MDTNERAENEIAALRQECKTLRRRIADLQDALREAENEAAANR